MYRYSCLSCFSLPRLLSNTYHCHDTDYAATGANTLIYNRSNNDGSKHKPCNCSLWTKLLAVVAIVLIVFVLAVVVVVVAEVVVLVRFF